MAESGQEQQQQHIEVMDLEHSSQSKISFEDVDYYAKLSLILNTPVRNSKTSGLYYVVYRYVLCNCHSPTLTRILDLNLILSNKICFSSNGKEIILFILTKLFLRRIWLPVDRWKCRKTRRTSF